MKQAIKQKLHWVVLLIFFAILLYQRLSWTYIGDDAAVVESINEYSVMDNFQAHFYSWSGRIFTDVLANLFYRLPFMLWKVFDSAVWTLMAYILVQLFTDKKIIDYVSACILLFLVPAFYISNAGYIATATNYVYTSCSMMVILYLYTLITSGKVKKAWWGYIIMIPCILYATNHDQSALVLILGGASGHNYLLYI